MQDYDFERQWRRVRRIAKEIWDEYESLFLILGCILGVAILAYGIWFMVDKATEANVARQIQEAESNMTQLKPRRETAEKTVASRGKGYPASYSAEFGDALANASEHIDNFFEPKAGLLVQLHDAQAKRDWGLARQLLDQVNSNISQDVATIDRILGPPGTEGQGWYDALDAKSAAVDSGLITQVQTKIDDALRDIGKRKNNLCGSTNELNYAAAFAVAAKAQEDLNIAKVTASKLYDGVQDKPRVYDEAKSAETKADQIISTAKELELQSFTAYESVKTCGDRIDGAYSSITGSDYRRDEALSTLELAKSEKQLALNACYVQDFQGVDLHARNCTDYSDQAISIATRPTATPVPPPTSIPIVVDDDDDDEPSDSGSWFDDSSDDDSWDYESDDSDSWDYDYDDSDSWDYDYDDSDSWDSDYDDGGSWDSDYDDSGSWD